MGFRISLPEGIRKSRKQEAIYEDRSRMKRTVDRKNECRNLSS